jgi:hypothetical protein
MPALNCCGDNILPSHPIQQSEQSILPPLSGELNLDEELKLSNEYFKQTEPNFIKVKHTTPLLTVTPAFPTPHILAQLVSKAYTDYRTGETDAQYETRLDLRDGWEIRTTASTSSKANGYFGSAYWHPEHQQTLQI